MASVWLFVTPWAVVHQAPLSMGFSRQECWSGLPCPPPGDLFNPGIQPESPVAPASQADSLPLSHWVSPICYWLANTLSGYLPWESELRYKETLACTGREKNEESEWDDYSQPYVCQWVSKECWFAGGKKVVMKIHWQGQEEGRKERKIKSISEL